MVSVHCRYLLHTYYSHSIYGYSSSAIHLFFCLLSLEYVHPYIYTSASWIADTCTSHVNTLFGHWHMFVHWHVVGHWQMFVHWHKFVCWQKYDRLTVVVAEPPTATVVWSHLVLVYCMLINPLLCMLACACIFAQVCCPIIAFTCIESTACQYNECIRWWQHGWFQYRMVLRHHWTTASCASISSWNGRSTLSWLGWVWHWWDIVGTLWRSAQWRYWLRCHCSSLPEIIRPILRTLVERKFCSYIATTNDIAFLEHRPDWPGEHGVWQWQWCFNGQCLVVWVSYQWKYVAVTKIKTTCTATLLQGTHILMQAMYDYTQCVTYFGEVCCSTVWHHVVLVIQLRLMKFTWHHCYARTGTCGAKQSCIM